MNSRSALTLLEVLLVLALIGSFTGLFVFSLESIGRTTPAEALEAAFWQGVRAGREEAVRSRRPARLEFSAEEMAFVVTGDSGVRVFPVEGEAAAGGRWGVAFLERLAARDFFLVRGSLVTERETDAVRLFPDGTCRPVVVEFRGGAGKRRVELDPWTCAELLPADEGEVGR